MNSESSHHAFLHTLEIFVQRLWVPGGEIIWGQVIGLCVGGVAGNTML